ncbi:hypothetical protein [Mumia sp. Pv 4-285]|uniref:hypothetical protein n=1 Tax=Mumia qirimensis TaxID=3234852 RepID=UPI00351D6405
MNTIPRTAGLGLLVFLAGIIVWSFAGTMGGNFHESEVQAFVEGRHRNLDFALYTVGALTSMGLIVFGWAVRDRVDRVGGWVWGLSVAGVATAVSGLCVLGGFQVAMAEGGAQAQEIPLSVAYTIGTIGHLFAGPAPALFVGTIALLLAAKAEMPGWMRVFTVLAGVCAITAALYFTAAVYLLWLLVFGIWVVAHRRPSARRSGDRTAESLV